MNNSNHDEVIVGGGHAGMTHEAARAGRRTGLLTHNLETLGQMPCNPSTAGTEAMHEVARRHQYCGGIGVFVTLARRMRLHGSQIYEQQKL